jgi:hypothetical protein
MFYLSPRMPPRQQREYLCQQGFPPEQIARLVAYRAEYQVGHYQQNPDEYRLLVFARWLHR